MSEQNDSNMPAYPLVPYSNALGVAEAVSSAGGAKSDVQKALIAQALKCSDTSGGFLQRISAARCFGMIEGRGSFRLTENAKRYFHPSSDNDKRRAQIAFFGSPPIFKKLIERFDGTKLPTPDNLANLLHVEMDVADSWKARVAGFFLRTAEAVGVVDGERFLRYRASQQSMGAGTQIPSTQKTKLDDGDKGRENSLPEGTTVWVFSLGGQSVRLETSSGDLPRALWDKLNGYVKVLEPAKQ